MTRTNSAVSGWLAGLVLGGLTGLSSLSFVLGILTMPLLLASVVLILWRGPRRVAAAGFVTGFGLAWTVLITNSTVSCLTIDRGPGRWCDPGDGWVGFLVAGAVIFVAGLAVSAVVFSRARRRP